VKFCIVLKNKLINQLLLYISYLIFGVLNLIKFISGYQFSVVTPFRIGHLAGEIDQFLREQRLNNKNHKRIIVTGKACNSILVKILSRHVKIKQSPFMFRLLSYMKRRFPQQTVILPLGMTLNEFSLYKKVNSLVNLLESEIEFGFQLIKKKYNIKKNDWWVCFHSRDNKYFEKNIKNDLRHHDYRNCEIKNMLLAMDHITKLGGYAIRYGAIAEEPLKTKNKKIIDYTFNGRTEFLDIFLMAKSRFFVGNTSGTTHLAKLFSVPYIMTNLVPFFPMPEQTKSIFLLKKMIDYNNKVMTYKDCYNLGMFEKEKGTKFSLVKGYQDLKITPLENSKEEILGATKDMLYLLENKKKSLKTIAKHNQIRDQFYSTYREYKLAGQLSPAFIKINQRLF